MKAPATNALPASVLTKRQVKTFRKEFRNGDVIIAMVRYDDECGNGHNSFAITGELYDRDFIKGESSVTNSKGVERYLGACGCLHEEIAKHFPELKPLIKWHLVSSKGPMHYVANTLWHASDSASPGKAPGTPCQFEERVQFLGFPVTFKASKSLREWMRTHPDHNTLEPVPVLYVKRPGETCDFKPKFTLTGFPVKEWHQAPFDSEMEAREWIAAMGHGWQFVEIPVGWIQPKERNLDYARSSAVWPEATDEELCQEPEKLKAALLERLPALMAEFYKAVTSEPLNFVY